ncbi:MAG: serine hydrolase domain-containing protein [Acidobacteriota bacterium]
MKIIRPTKLLLIALFLALPFTALADGVDEFVRAQMAERHIPGVAVAVLKNGKVVKEKGYGVASLEFNVPVTPATAFEIGSVSKQMTAAGIMLLVEDGKIDLDEHISKYLLDTPDAWKDVTVRHLLTHTSGVKSYTSLDGFGLIKRMKAADFIKALSPYPLEFTPGEKNIYSNSGFSLLAYIIESVAGKPYMDFMQERVFRPLGMVTATDRDPLLIIPNRAVGYEWASDHYTGRSWDLTDLKGAGTIVCTVRDLIKWDQALRGSTFLKPSSRAEIWKNYIFNDGKPSPYGFGWRLSDIRGHRLIGHTGQTAGFSSANFRFVDDGVDVIILTDQGQSPTTAMATAIAKMYVPAMSIRAMKEVAGEQWLTDLVRKAFRQRADNHLSEDVFTAEQVRALSSERAKEGNLIIAAAGPIKALTLVGSQDEIGTKTYLYRAETQHGASLWRVAATPDRRISAMTVEERE